MRDAEGIQKKQSRKEWSEVTDFLKSIDFLNDNTELTDIGREYYKSKFILNDDNLSAEILGSALKRFLPTQAICQLLWGRPNLNKQSVYRLLVLEEYINSKEFKEQDLGGFLMLLNQCSILKYNKKSSGVTILYNPRTSEDVEISTKFLSPETPYSNVRNLREILRNSTEFVHWFDKHFSLKGLEPLHDEADGTKINEIRILSGITSGRVNERLRDDFIRFRDEMKTRQINAELRILCNKEILNDIHDRWIVSKNSVFNIPPVDTIFQGQYSEMKKTENRPPFEEWWLNGLDIIAQWQEIMSQSEKQSSDKSN
jgi:hypothetical protein